MVSVCWLINLTVSTDEPLAHEGAALINVENLLSLSFASLCHASTQYTFYRLAIPHKLRQ